MEKIAFYCRTSTSEQEKQETIKVQLAELKKVYGDKKIVRIYKDEGYSGAYLQRPALSQMREDIKKGLFNVLALYSLDRFSRNLGDQCFLQGELKNNEIEIEILGKKIENTPQGELSNNVLSAVAQYERQMITQRMKDGIRRRIEDGILVGCRPPLGYRLIKRDREKRTEARFEIDPVKALIVRDIFRIFINEQNIRETTRQINKLHGLLCQPRRTAERLRDTTYIGKFYYYKKAYYIQEKDGKLKHIVKPTPERKKLIKVPAIIDKATFDKAQEILTIRRDNYNTKSKYNYLLQGLIRCVHCGSFYGGQITGYVKGKHYFSYVCHKKKNPPMGKKRCKSKTMGSRILENYVWSRIKSYIKNPDKVKKAIRILQEGRKSKKVENQRKYDSLMVEKEKIKQAKRKLLKAYAFEGVNPEDIESQTKELSNQEEVLNKEIEKVQRDLKAIDKMNRVENEIERLCLEYQEGDLDNATFEIRKLIVRKWVKEINITDNRDILLKVRVPIFEEIPLTALTQHSVSLMPVR